MVTKVTPLAAGDDAGGADQLARARGEHVGGQ
jgi:hypothetical protein